MAIVYSTGAGSMGRGCRRSVAERVGRQTQSRAGKGVTLITGLPLAAAELAALASDLKRYCGSGGTVKDGAIELQGEHRDAVVVELQRRGFAARRSGG